MPETVSPTCPDCQATDTLREVHRQYVQEQRHLTLIVRPGGVIDSYETEESDSEVLDSDYETLRCDDCGYETDDASDFICQHEDSEDGACLACGEYTLPEDWEEPDA